MTKANGTTPPLAREERPLTWIHPREWKVNNRTRKYITFSERNYSRKNELDILRRSVAALLRQQDERGSFYSDKEYLRGDVVDDQIGAAAMLACFLSCSGPDETVRIALERAVRFHLDHLVFRSPDRPYCYSRFFNDRDTAGDWCNTLWCISGGIVLLRHGGPHLTTDTWTEFRAVMTEFWSFVSTFPMRDENPCHNQLLAYCEIGILYGKTVGWPELVSELLTFYHAHMRRLRILDRGYHIYSEFNQWDSHYGVLSWFFLELLFVETGDPAFAEDAEQMALYFNEQLSAGGYCWGGSRNNECGIDEFPHLFTARLKEYGFERALFPEPSHLWHRMVVGGHGGGGLSGRLERTFASPAVKRTLCPTPWHFQSGNASVCLRNNYKLHHLSSAGLELIPVAGTEGLGSGVRWFNGTVWKSDLLQASSPPASDGLRFYDAKPFQVGTASGLTSMHRGYLWETRQWWISSSDGLLWVVQLIPHAFLNCDALEFLLGTPVLTRLGGIPVPVSEVENDGGVKADTQGAAATLTSQKFLRFGDISVGATAPVEFRRPAGDAFHTFPLPKGLLWRDELSSNYLRVRLFDEPKAFELRESYFFAVQIGATPPSLDAKAEHSNWKVASNSKFFEARQNQGLWSYTLNDGSTKAELPAIGFTYRLAH
jgi:hypothetical protein